jgi:hypothetical protein
MASSAGTCTITEETFGTIKKIKFAVVTGSGASVNSIGSTTTTAIFSGNIRAMTTVGTGGGTAPSASWDITLVDQSSVDVLIGAGTNRAAAVEHTKEASMGAVANDNLTLTVSGMGSSNAAAVYVYIR